MFMLSLYANVYVNIGHKNKSTLLKKAGRDFALVTLGGISYIG